MSIYLDYAATTPMPEGVAEVYTQALTVVGNPSSVHQQGQAARVMVEEARATLGELLGVDPMEVTFTSGGTESINTWLKGRTFAHRSARGASEPLYLVLTRAEHHATLDAVEWLEKHGFATPLWVAVDPDGVMDLEDLERVLGSVPSEQIAGVTTLVANNEVGSIQPVESIVELARAHGDIPVHLDAIQAFGQIPLNVPELGADAVSISAHKLGGPVGVGALVMRRGASPIETLLHGGNQQPSRSGTLDAAGAHVFAHVARQSVETMVARHEQLSQLRDLLMDGLAAYPGVEVRGSISTRLPNNVHVTLQGAKGEVALYLFDEQGVSVSTGSACQAGVAEESHVLRAMGCDSATASSALRLTLGSSTTQAEVERVVELFPGVLEKARAASGK
ncbi:MAG: cysteine desulfurase family protein [Pontimonas sp.]